MTPPPDRYSSSARLVMDFGRKGAPLQSLAIELVWHLSMRLSMRMRGSEFVVNARGHRIGRQL
jgi:hypothetical protein